LSLTDLEEPLEERAGLIAGLFEEEIDNYYYHVEDRVRTKDQEDR